MSDEIPQWAFDRVDSLAWEERAIPETNDDYSMTGHAFARYIMQHEEPPVDKDVLMMRDILASQWDEGSLLYRSIMDGCEDETSSFQDALAAYRKHKR